MSTDPTAWLLGQVDEDERIAQAAPRRDWTVYLAGDSDTGELTEQRVLDHVARHDPARVLAEVAAKRAILDLHDQGDKADECAICFAVWPCGTLRALATVYADRDGYDERWRP